MSAPRPAPRKRLSLREIFAIPAGLFLVSLLGLVAALLVDGWVDAIAALAAGAGLVAMAWVMRPRR